MWDRKNSKEKRGNKKEEKSGRKRTDCLGFEPITSTFKLSQSELTVAPEI